MVDVCALCSVMYIVLVSVCVYVNHVTQCGSVCVAGVFYSGAVLNQEQGFKDFVCVVGDKRFRCGVFFFYTLLHISCQSASGTSTSPFI